MDANDESEPGYFPAVGMVHPREKLDRHEAAFCLAGRCRAGGRGAGHIPRSV